MVQYTFRTHNQTFCRPDLKKPCGRPDAKDKEALRSHFYECLKCRSLSSSSTTTITRRRTAPSLPPSPSSASSPSDSPSNKKLRVDPEEVVSEVVPVATSTSIPVMFDGALARLLKGEELELHESVSSGELRRVVRLATKWPVSVDPKTHVEWNDADLTEKGLFDDWGKPGLQQKWTLLLMNVIFYNQGMTFTGCVAETYDRNEDRDCFAERPNAVVHSSAPIGFHRYNLVRLSISPGSFRTGYLTLGTDHMNAIFTKVVITEEGRSPKLFIGKSAGSCLCATSKDENLFEHQFDRGRNGPHWTSICQDVSSAIGVFAMHPVKL